MEVLPLRKIFFHRVGLVMYKYTNHLLPECIAQLYLRNDSIHEHNTRGCQLLRVPLESKTFSVPESGMLFLLNLIAMFRFHYSSVI